MRELLLQRVRPLVDRLANDLAALAVDRIEAELVRMGEAFSVALSSYQSDSPPDLLTAALGPELAQMLNAPTKKPHRKRIRVREYEPENYPPSRRAREHRTEPQKNGTKPITCSKCGFVGGNARGCGRAHPTQTQKQAVESSDDDSEPHRAAPQRTTRNLQATYEMITRAQAGDQAAMTELVRQNIGLVHWVARRHAWSSVPYEDMIQEGAIGLVEAIKRFDVSRGLKLSTYAPTWIRHFIGRAHENDGLIRLPVQSHHQLRLVHRAQKGLGPEATLGEIAQRAGLRLNTVSRLLDRGTVIPAATLPDVAAPATDDDEGRLAIAHEHVAALPERLRRVMELRYSGDGMTLREAGNVLGVSRERVRQLEVAALRAIRSKLKQEAANA